MPQLMVRAAAYEANKFQGDDDAAANELSQFGDLVRSAGGYENNGAMSLGGVM
jgi:hypothetical protein